MYAQGRMIICRVIVAEVDLQWRTIVSQLALTLLCNCGSIEMATKCLREKKIASKFIPWLTADKQNCVNAMSFINEILSDIG